MTSRGVDEALKKLSEHPNEDFVVDFVQKKHLGFLNGKLGSTKKKLEEDLGIKISIDNLRGIFKISGPFENKKNAITEIKYARFFSLNFLVEKKTAR